MSKRPPKYVMEWMSRSLAILYGIDEIIYSGKTKYQLVDIVKTRDYGLALILDGLLQSAEIDEYVYHESLVHPVMISHPNPKKVLIVGGGEGATAREVERYDMVEEIEMVDLDGELIELVKKYLPWSREGFNDPRLKLTIMEGREYLSKQPDGKYDIIIMDATDPTEFSPAIKLYTREFYQMAFKKLKDDGILVTQSSSPAHTLKLTLSILKTIESIFPKSCLYSVYIKSFASIWSFSVGSKGPQPSSLTSEEVDRRLRERNVTGLRFYSGEIHRALFSLTEALLRNWKTEPQILTDEKPLTLDAIVDIFHPSLVGESSNLSSTR